MEKIKTKRYGKQEYQRKECKRKFIRELNYDEEFKRKAIQIFYEGNSERAVGRIMKINKFTVYNWIKALNRKVKEPDSRKENEQNKKIIEMDELLSYTKQKSRTYLITLVTRKPRQIVEVDIAFDRSQNRIQNIVNNATKAKFYFSDANPSYQNVSYWGKHFYFKDKCHTFTVEGINFDIRKYIVALQRRSKCFFRSLGVLLNL